MFSNKAEMGIGTLIIFIAMILVASIAAGVLIQTAGSLQNKALLTGARSEDQVSTGIMPILFYGEDGITNSSIDSLFLKAKLLAGSNPIAFEDMLIEFSLDNSSQDLEYVTGTCTSLNDTHFKVEYLISGASNSIGYLSRGDVVKICFNSSRSVLEDEFLSLTIIPKIGGPLVIETATPDIITEQRVTIFP